MKNLDLIGKKIWKLDGEEGIQGQTRYGTDLSMSGMLYVKAYRARIPHGKLLRLDVSKAAALDGVSCVLTAKDIPGEKKFGFPAGADQPVLVEVGGTILMKGDALALVASPSLSVAEKALSLIEAEYEQYEAIDDYERVANDSSYFLKNECSGEYSYERGDLSKGQAEADVILEGSYEVPIQEHAYMETESGLSYYDSKGILTVESGTHDAFYVRYEVARCLGIDEIKVRSIVPLVGGTYGGKQQCSTQLHIALVTQKTGLPAKMVWSRRESMLVSHKRHPAKIHMRMGATKDGAITFLESNYVMDGGPYSTCSSGVCYWMGTHSAGPYNIPNVSINGKAVYTNNTVGAAFRGFGGPQGVFPLERHMDKMARELNMDAQQLRAKNYIREKDQPACNGVLIDTRVTVGEALEKAIEKLGPLPQPSTPHAKVGRGYAVAMPLHDVSSDPVWGMGGTGAHVEIFRDGSIEVRSGTCEFGSGLDTVQKLIISNEFGVPMERIHLITSDTYWTPKVGRCVGSKGAYASGQALLMASQELKERLATIAAVHFGTYPVIAPLVFANERIYTNQQKRDYMTLAEAADFAYRQGMNLAADSWYVNPNRLNGNAFCAMAADVEVDMLSYETKVLRCGYVHDAGTIINPLAAIGQAVGGVTQSIGYALTEKWVIEKGESKTLSFHDYTIPTSVDTPHIEVEFIEEPSTDGPYGAKGLSEHPSYVGAVAIVNAVSNALDTEFDVFPLTPDKLYTYLHG
ncbi:xanthine dehydrogenase family protein molybdopterin-binding subunit [Ruminococcaceae bacterium OttesenSCG-928-I18]|nr:xanthine dehydrogenase family protein molybdopterin-binding subunit [Ruminococcaceae bacterium OttesenSCG-928-I18]